MKTLLIIILFLSGISLSHAQSDSAIQDFSGWSHGKYMQSIYSPETMTYNTSYNYSNLWDLDGDGKKDSLFFIGNGGAHTYFFLRIVLSGDHIVRDFENVQLDMPYFKSKEELDQYGKNPGLQFALYDFDKDGISDIYLNLDNTWSSVPEKWKREGVISKYVLMSFNRGKMKVRNY